MSENQNNEGDSVIPRYEFRKREYRQYMRVAQLNSFMKDSFSNNHLAREKLLLPYNSYTRNPDGFSTVANNILKEGIDINYRLPETSIIKSCDPLMIGSTLLYLAAKKNDINMFKYLITKGADFTVKNNNQTTVIHYVMYKSYYKRFFDSISDEGELIQDEFIKTVLSAHITYNNFWNPCDRHGVSHFSIACMTNNVEAVKFFLDNGVPYYETRFEDIDNSSGYTPLHYAVMYGAFEVTQMLLNWGADITATDSKGRTALHLLIEQKMKIWLKKTRMVAINFDIEQKEYDNINWLYNKNNEIMWLLLNHQMIDGRSYTNEFDFMRFCAICTMTSTQTVEDFLKSKSLRFVVFNLNQAIDMNSDFYAGYTALHFAAYFCVKTVILLVKIGANILARDSIGMTPFDICFQRFKVEDIYNIIQLRSDLSSITFLNGGMKLIDFIEAMRDPIMFEEYHINARSFLPFDSPICPGYTPLHLAVCCTEVCPTNWGDGGKRLPRYFKRIAICVEASADVTSLNSDGLTPIHQAFRLSENKVALNLLKSQIKVVNPVDPGGLSHYHIVCALEDNDFITNSVAFGYFGIVIPPITSNVSHFPENSHREHFISSRSTPLHIAADNGNLKVVAVLLLRGHANVFDKDINGLTAIERASNALEINKSSKAKFIGYRRVRDYLIKRAISQTKEEPSVFNKLLCDILHRIRYNLCLESFFIDDLNSNHANLEIMRKTARLWLIENMGITMLHFACYFNDYEEFSKLLKDGTDVNACVYANSPLYAGCTPLHFAVESGARRNSEQMVHELLKAGADVTIFDSDQRTPLHVAFDFFSQKKSSSVYGILDALLDKHTNFRVNPEDVKGVSHFHIACLRNKNKLIKKFLEKGVNVNKVVDHFARDFGGYAPLHFSAIRPIKAVYSRLLQCGANLHVKDRLGNTPLHVAVKCGNGTRKQIFKDFLSAGADPNAKNFVNETPLEVLLDSYKDSFLLPQIVEIFIRHGARVNIVNPLSHIGYLSQSMRLTTIDMSMNVFNKLIKSHDVMNVNEDNGYTAIHNIVAYDLLFNHTSTHTVLSSKRVGLHAMTIEILTKMNLNIDSQDKKGMTALHVATVNGNVDAVKGLLDNGSDINIIDKRGYTAFTYSWNAYNEDYDNLPIKKFDSIVLHIFHVLFIHVHKLLIVGIHVNELNEKIYHQALVNLGSFLKNPIVHTDKSVELEMQKIASLSLNVRNLLSETGTVLRSRRRKTEKHRQEIDEFFEVHNIQSLRKKFNTMTSLLKLQYRKLTAGEELLLTARNSLINLFQNCLPVVVCNEIVRFLANHDLQSTIKAAEMDNTSIFK